MAIIHNTRVYIQKKKTRKLKVNKPESITYCTKINFRAFLRDINRKFNWKPVYHILLFYA